MRITLGSAAAAAALCLFVAASANAAGEGAQLKADIDGLLGKLEASSHGLIKWQGADRMDVRDDGDGAVADIANAKISIGTDDKPTAKRTQVSFDHIEIRRVPAPDGASKLSVVFPQQGLLTTPEHNEIKLTLKSATGSAVIDTKSGRARESQLAVASARLDDKATGDWVSFGPLSWSGKLAGAANGGWTGPMDLELKKVEFFAAQGPATGAIDRIAYTARSSGPDLAALNKLRDKLDAMRKDETQSPQKRVDAMLDLLPGLLSLFTDAKGEMSLEGLVVRPAKGEPFVSLKKVHMGGALTGLSGENAALRITVGHEGLSVAPSLLPAKNVPGKAVVDIGVEDVSTAALRAILDAASTMRPEASATDKELAKAKMIGAAAMLNPTFRIYRVAVDTPSVGVDATGEAKGSPLSPKGYSAEADIAVRGFDALAEEASAIGAAAVYLPLLKEIGTPAKADDGSPRLKFHLASTMQKLLTINGSDVKPWLTGAEAGPGQPRNLRPALPVMTGADVDAVQKALAAAKIAAPQNGAYDGATAAAVARFQKANALDANGVVDAATRQKLGVKPVAAAPPAKKQAN